MTAAGEEEGGQLGQYGDGGGAGLGCGQGQGGGGGECGWLAV